MPTYFISYAFRTRQGGWGYGNVVMSRDQGVCTKEDLREVIEMIENDPTPERAAGGTIAILGWQQLEADHFATLKSYVQTRRPQLMLNDLEEDTKAMEIAKANARGAISFAEDLGFVTTDQAKELWKNVREW